MVVVDGKTLGWAREYEPYIRQKVNDGWYSEATYYDLLKRAQLAKYFPEV